LFHEIWVHEVYTPGGYDIRPRDTVVDVGANIGVFALYAAARAGEGRVLAYEPFPESYDYLRRNVAESGLRSVTAFPVAVAGSPGERSLQITPDRLITNSLAPTGVGMGGPTVPCVTLDQVFEGNGIQVCDLLKLDCEGSEYEILQNSSPETLARIRRVVGEYHEGPSIPGTGAGLVRFLEEGGFCIDRFEAFERGGGLFCAKRKR
jgi:FkbM family methyltransferase